MWVSGNGRMQIHRPKHENCFHPMRSLTTFPPPRSSPFSILRTSSSLFVQLFPFTTETKWPSGKATVCEMTTLLDALGHRSKVTEDSERSVSPLLSQWFVTDSKRCNVTYLEQKGQAADHVETSQKAQLYRSFIHLSDMHWAYINCISFNTTAFRNVTTWK